MVKLYVIFIQYYKYYSQMALAKNAMDEKNRKKRAWEIQNL